MSQSTPSTLQALPALVSTLSIITDDATTDASSFPFDQNLDVLKHVFSFVGQKQYRFVAGVNRCFQEAYLEEFPNEKWTYLNTSTEELARLCWSEIKHPNMHPNIYHQWVLCRSAAAHGKLPSLQFLRSVKCDWNERTCAAAAGTGHLNIVQWCRENGCPWDEYKCSSAAQNGHLNVLQWCRRKGCPLACVVDLYKRSRKWPLECVAMVSRKRMSMGWRDLRNCSRQWSLECAAMVSRK